MDLYNLWDLMGCYMDLSLIVRGLLEIYGDFVVEIIVILLGFYIISFDGNSI